MPGGRPGKLPLAARPGSSRGVPGSGAAPAVDSEYTQS